MMIVVIINASPRCSLFIPPWPVQRYHKLIDTNTVIAIRIKIIIKALRIMES
jgi:hypothetical protein